MILSLRPGTRQDPLKNSSGLLAPSVGVSLPRVGPGASWLSATIQHAAGPCLALMSSIYTGAHLCGLCGRGRIRTCGASRFLCLRPLGHSPMVAGRAPACQTNYRLLCSKHPRVALYTCLLYLSSKHSSSVISPVPLQNLHVAGRYGCIPFPPQCGQMIGSFSSMA